MAARWGLRSSGPGDKIRERNSPCGAPTGIRHCDLCWPLGEPKGPLPPQAEGGAWGPAFPPKPWVTPRLRAREARFKERGSELQGPQKEKPESEGQDTGRGQS